jgi:hypothetical protein
MLLIETELHDILKDRLGKNIQFIYKNKQFYERAIRLNKNEKFD